MSMQHWWNETDREKLKYLKKNLSQCVVDLGVECWVISLPYCVL
jgi:hypothetical protein